MSRKEDDAQMLITSINNKSDDGKVDRASESNILKECSDLKDPFACHKDNTFGGQNSRDKVTCSADETGSTSVPNFMLRSSEGVMYKAMGAESVNESVSLAQTILASPFGNPNPFHGAVVEDVSNLGVFSPFQQISRSRQILPRPSESIGLESNAGFVPQIRVARPPAEGRVKNQLLPRYWPRITEQELRQISGDSNSTIVPLFEKVLSASDAGRIGRLVLPKACAEAYFPPISQPEGLPLRIQDVKGKEWVFQFRFWPNNNSRMYVMEGVTPCIQSMQLQAGDTVTFSRMDPKGKLLMGFRKASNNMSIQGSTDPHLTLVSKSSGVDLSLQVTEKKESHRRDGFMQHSMTMASERKRSRSIGSKSKRILIDSQEALELKLTWVETQDLFRPPVFEKPSVVTIEALEFEEYEEVPVFGKRSIFSARSSGCQEQWTLCDSCSKWRKLPVDILLPPKWTCMDNIWDLSRSSCSAPDELSPRDLENFLGLNKEFKRQRMLAYKNRLAEEQEFVTLNTFENAAAIGEGFSNTSDVATTTKHPRHRPGCSCIVCIQPPSGKGKHKPTCTCNVCMTVKRRFKTLMLRKKQRQSERQAEVAQRSQNIWGTRDESEVDSMTKQQHHSDNEKLLQKEFAQLSENRNGKLDLNRVPDREEKLHPQGFSHVSMTNLVQVASLPLEIYMKQNGLTSLIPEQQLSSGSDSLAQPAGLQRKGQEIKGNELD